MVAAAAAAASGRGAAVQFQTGPDKAEFVSSLFGSVTHSDPHRKEEFVRGVSNASRLNIHNSPPPLTPQPTHWVEFLFPLRPFCCFVKHSVTDCKALFKITQCGRASLLFDLR